MSRTLKTGFTLTELLALVSLGTILSALIVPDLAQTRAKLLQQACAANMKQWGMAIDMYSLDYNGTFYYRNGLTGVDWDDSNSPYGSYLITPNTNTVPFATTRRMRICPARAAGMAQDAIDVTPFHNYSIPIGRYRQGAAYVDADTPGSPYFDSASASYFPNLKSVRDVSQYLLMIESSGHTLKCGSLVSAVTGINAPPSDTVAATNRHGGPVNCLFGDQHVELISFSMIASQNSISCSSPPGNRWFTLN